MCIDHTYLQLPCSKKYNEQKFSQEKNDEKNDEKKDEKNDGKRMKKMMKKMIRKNDGKMMEKNDGKKMMKKFGRWTKAFSHSRSTSAMEKSLLQKNYQYKIISQLKVHQ